MSDTPPPLDPATAAMFDSIFKEMFARGGSTGPGAAAQGGDLVVELALTDDEAATGAQRAVQVTRVEPCGPCAGLGSATPGATRTPCAACAGTGTHITTQGQFAISATCATCAGTRGRFADPCATCAGSGERSAPATLEVTVPAGVVDGQTLRLANAGSRRAGAAARGHVFVVLRVGAHVMPPEVPRARVVRTADGVARPARARVPAAVLVPIAIVVAVIAAAYGILYR